MEYQWTDANFQTEVLESKTPTLVDFYADWCGPCKMMAPLVEDLAKEYDGRVRIGKLNVDQNPNTAAAYRVMSIPTFLLFQDGRPVETVMGAVPKSELQALLDRVVS